MASISNISVTFAANTAQFISGLTKMDVSTKKWSKQLGRDFKAAGQDIRAMSKIAVASYTAIVAAIAAGTTKSIAEIKKLTDEAAKVGASSSGFAQLAYAAELSGTDIGTLKKGMDELRKSLNEAAVGSIGAKNAFAELGIDIGEFSELTPDERIMRFVEALENIDDPTERARLGTKLLKDSYTELNPLLNKGVIGLTELRLEAVKTGAALSEVDNENVAVMVDSFDKLKKTFGGMFNILGAALAPTLKSLFDDFDKFLSTGEGKMATLRDALLYLSQPIVWLIKGVEGIYVAWLKGQQGVLLFADALAGGVVSILKGLDTADNAYTAFFDMLYDNINKVIKAFNRFSPVKIPEITDDLRGKGDLFEGILAEAESIREDIQTSLKGLSKDIMDVEQKGISATITKVINDVTNGMAAVFNRIKDEKTKIEKTLDELNKAKATATQPDTRPDDVKIESALTEFFGELDQKAYNIAYERVSKDMQEFRTQEMKLTDKLLAVQDALNMKIISQGEAARYTNQIQEELWDITVNNFIESSHWINNAATAMQSFADSMSNAIVSGQSLGKVFTGLLKQIAAMVIRSMMLNVILSAVGLASPVAAGALANLMGMQKSFGGARAKGGPVDNSSTYMVGEQGPELFTPNRSGYIIPNNALTDEARTPRVTVVQNIAVTPSVATTVRAELAAAMPLIRQNAIAGVAQATVRGGGISNQIRGY